MAQDLWTPVDAPSLWAKVLAGQGGTEIGEWVQEEWISTVDNNIWPLTYTAGTEYNRRLVKSEKARTAMIKYWKKPQPFARLKP